MPQSLKISDELSELVHLLNSHRVDYIIAGSHALAFHGVPRFTEDIDFFLARTRENLDRLAVALQDFGIDLPEASRKEMLDKEKGIIVIGHQPNRADFLNFLDGVDYKTAAQSKVEGLLGEELVFFLSLEDFVATKKATARTKDLLDLALLQTVHPEISF